MTGRILQQYMACLTPVLPPCSWDTRQAPANVRLMKSRNSTVDCDEAAMAMAGAGVDNNCKPYTGGEMVRVLR